MQRKQHKLLRKLQNNIVKRIKINYNGIVGFGNPIYSGVIMKNSGTKRIKTERLVLKKMKMSDWFYAKKWFCDPRVSVYSQGTVQNTPHDMYRFLLQRVYNYYFKRKNNYYFWGIYLRHRMIGFIEVRDLTKERKYYWLYYMLSPEFQSNGYTTEALVNVIEYMKSQSAEIIYGACDTENKASYRVLEKADMTYIRHEEDIFHYPDGRVGARELFGIKLKEQK